MRDLWFLGLYATDYLYYVGELPRPEESVMARDFLMADGGKASNQAACAALLGASAELVTYLSDGPEGRTVGERLGAMGVGLSHTVRGEAAQACSAIVIDGAGNQTITTAMNGAADISRENVRRLLENAKPGAILSLQGELSELTYRAAREVWAGTVVVNPSPLGMFLGTDLLDGVDWVVANQIEAEELTVSAAPTAKKLAQATGARAALVTGSDVVRSWTSADGEREYAVHRVPAVDTTGAGDAFTGGFLSALAEGLPIDACVERAMRVSRFSVQRRGCVPSYPGAEQVGIVRQAG